MTKRLLMLMLNDEYCNLNFDIYGLMLYYVKKINNTKALLLYKSTVSEYFYKLLRDIPVGSLTSEDEQVAITIEEIPEVINFINTEIIPLLMLETQSIIQKFGGSQSFENLFRNEDGFTEDIFLYEDYEPDDSDKYFKGSMIHSFEYLRNFLQYVLVQNKLYDVFVD